MSDEVAVSRRLRSSAARRAPSGPALRQRLRAGARGLATATLPRALEPLESRLLMSSVAGRYVFYNHSVFDGNNPAASAGDSGAIAVDKTALLPGDTAAFANYTSYSRGINGVAVDVAGDPGTLDIESFGFKVGNTADPSSWAPAPAPAQVARLGPDQGSDTARYLITWSDGAIKNQWLQVTVKADAGTGLAAPDVFYFGNIIGETGDRPGSATVNVLDLLKVRRRLRGRTAGLADPSDFNRDGRVNALDLGIVRVNSSRVPLRLITAPSVDLVLPSVSITAPVDGSAVSGALTINADSADNVAVAGVQFLLDGAALGPEDTVAPYSIAWDTTSAGEGSHRLTAIARDEAGNVAVSAPVDVSVANADTAPPSVAVTAPAAAATVAAAVTLSAEASDNVGVVGVQFYVDGAAVGGEDTSFPYSISWDSASVADGPHSITARARDAAGNAATSPARGVTVSNSPTSPAAVGQWSGVMNWPLVAINQVLLNDGRVLMWDGEGGDICIGSTSARVYDPVRNQFTPVPVPWFTKTEDDIFCSGQTLLADGRVFVVGGHDCNGPGTGIKQTALFDPATMTWTRGPDMHYARWYPTATTLSDGRVLILGGAEMANSDFVPIPEIYDPAGNSITALPAASFSIPSYSFVFQHPDGRVIVTGSDESKMRTYALDVAAQKWSVLDNDVMDAGSGVMYRPGKFMKAGSSYLADPEDNGGAVPSLATTYVLDTAVPSPDWQQTASMARARSHLNLTLLPDGNVLAVGGSSDIGGLTPSRAVFPAELWSPETQTWTTMASMQTPRMYHSTSLLLPDGRVLVAGGGRLFTATPYLSAEIYSPGYLFKGPRPTISSSPQTLAYGGDFFVGTPDGGRVASVALVRNGSVTHGVDMNQRYLPLSFSQRAGGLTVQAPADSKLAPPGDYMLFVVDSNGVPSVAPFVRFAVPGLDVEAPTAPAGLAAATGAPGVVSLQWTAATDNVSVVSYNVYRSTVAGFISGGENLVGSTASTTYTDSGLAAGTYYYIVRAADAAGNIGPASNQASAVSTADTTAPAVSVTAPAAGATVSDTVNLSADASDDVGVASVRFLIDGVQAGAADTSAPYSVAWSSRGVANGSHTLTAIARDASGNETASQPVAFEVSNTAVPGLVAAWGFDEGTGSTASDATGNGHSGAITNAEWHASGKFGGALLFDGVDSWVTVDDAVDLHLAGGMTVEAWVMPYNIDGFETVVLKERPGGLSYALYANNAEQGPGVPTGWVQTQAGYDLGANGTSLLPLNIWTHLATTYDGQEVRLYVNGTFVRAVPVQGELESSADALRIGGNAVWGEFFSGLIDEVRVYNRPLTAADIHTDSLTPITGAAAAGGIATAALPAVFPPGTFADSSPATDPKDPATSLLV